MTTRPLLPIALAAASLHAAGQQRYLEEVFTDAEITVTGGHEYAVNIDFLTSNLGCSPAALGGELTELHTDATLGQPYRAAYFDPQDGATCIKLARLRMDVYAPSPTADPVQQRPVMIYLHNGSLLPPCVNGLPLGSRTDSVAVEICRRMARRGYVAVSASYRLGWNPLVPDQDTARYQLLNAVYRAMHDTKMAIRAVRRSVDAGNPWGVDPAKVILLGQGTGGFIAPAVASLDRDEELFAGQLLWNPFVPTSYIDTALFGQLDGYGGQFNLYRPNGYDADIQFSVNLGGGIVDTLWIEAGDAPMVSVHCVRDDLTPFNMGPVLTPIGLVALDTVYGGNCMVRQANSLGNNASFAGLHPPGTDPCTDQARSLYGTSWSTAVPPNTVTVTPHPLAEGLFPVVRPLLPPFENEGQPWQWWDPVAMAGCGNANNPDMSAEKGRTYVDTIMGYMNPRIVCALQLGPCSLTGVDETEDAAGMDVFPNPAVDALHITAQRPIRAIEVLDLQGRLLRTERPNADRAVLHRNGLSPGTYLVRSHFADGTATRRVVFE